MKYIELYDYDESDLSDARVSIFGNANSNLDVPYGGTFPVGYYTSADLYANHVGLPGTEFAARGIRVPAGLTAQIFLEDYF